MSATSHGGRSGPGWRSAAWAQHPTGGMASLRGDAGQSFSTTQQIERAVDLGQVPPGDVEIPCGRVDGAVAEQKLDRVEIHPGFQQMRGKAMPEGMDAFAVGERSGARGVVVGRLSAFDGAWLGAILAVRSSGAG